MSNDFKAIDTDDIDENGDVCFKTICPTPPSPPDPFLKDFFADNEFNCRIQIRDTSTDEVFLQLSPSILF